MLLYQPTNAEIDETIVKALANFPHLIERFDKARDLLLDVSTWSTLHDKDTVWYLPGKSDPRGYHNIERCFCTCANYKYHQADAGGQPVCKHTLAVRSYRRILTIKLQAHLADGSTTLDLLELGEYSARRDGARCRIHRDHDHATYREWGPIRWRNDYSLLCYASQLAEELQPAYMPWSTGHASRSLALGLPR